MKKDVKEKVYCVLCVCFLCFNYELEIKVIDILYGGYREFLYWIFRNGIGGFFDVLLY